MKFLKKFPRSANFNDCGLGKTLEELVVILDNWDTTHNRVLVFCPKSCIASWIDEVEKHTDLVISEDVKFVSGSTEEKTQVLHTRGRMFITNYETVLTNFSDLLAGGFNHIVCDESTRVKNPAAKTSQAITILADRADIVRIMSGLPIPQSPTEIFSQFRIMDKGETFGTNYYRFLAKWFYKVGKWPYTKHKLKKEVKDVFMSHILSKGVRHLRQSIIQLPPLATARRTIEWSNQKIKEQYVQLENEVRKSVKMTAGGEIQNLDHALVKLNKLSQYTGGFIYDMEGAPHMVKDNSKLEELKEVLFDYDIRQNKVIIVGIYRPTLGIIFNLCDTMGFNPVLLYGETDTEDRIKGLKKFETDPTCRILVGNEKTLAYGLNLQTANIIIFYDINFSVDQYKQVCDRIYRIGQHKDCLLIHLLIEDTFDILKYKLVTGKLDKASILMAFLEG